ncbi:hypothetical protein EJB05_31966, partial [Eragrostis curvula]
MQRQPANSTQFVPVPSSFDLALCAGTRKAFATAPPPPETPPAAPLRLRDCAASTATSLPLLLRRHPSGPLPRRDCAATQVLLFSTRFRSPSSLRRHRAASIPIRGAQANRRYPPRSLRRRRAAPIQITTETTTPCSSSPDSLFESEEDMDHFRSKLAVLLVDSKLNDFRPRAATNTIPEDQPEDDGAGDDSDE